MSPRAWIRKTDYPDWTFDPAFEALSEQRARLLEVLEPLQSDAWDLTATVTGTSGDVAERSARFYGDWMARHEREHVEQISEILEPS